MFNAEIYLVFVTIGCLLWAAYEDLKHRLIPDKVWLVQIGFSIPALVVWFNENQSFIPRALVVSNIILGIIFGFAFLLTGAFGGGDSKALITSSISLPFLFTVNTPSTLILMPPIFLFLTNMVIFFLLFSFYLFIQNILSISKLGPLFSETNGNMIQKISIMISGRRIPQNKVEFLKHEDPAEVFEGRWVLYTPLFEKPLEDDEYEIKEKEAREKAWIDVQHTERSYLWTRPQPPGLVFFVLAYLYLIFIGSPLLLLLS